MRRLGTALIILSLTGMAAGVVNAQSPLPTQSPSPAQPLAGVPVYVPEAHVGLTLPVGWSVSVEYRRADPPPGESMPADARWVVLTAWESQDVADGCRLFRFEGSGLSLAEFAAGLLDPRTEVTVSAVSFDAGKAIRLDLALGGPWVAQQYVFGSDDTFYQLACVSSGAPPGDDWLSIAETFEFLPAEESPDTQARSHASDLVALFPSTLDGRALGVEDFSGSEWISRYDPESPEGAVALERAEALLAAAGTSVEDLTVATALHVPSPGNVATIAAVQLRGIEAHELVEPAIGLMRGEIDSPQLRLRPIADRTVLTVRDASAPGMYPVTVYPVGDTVWFVDAGGPLLERILEALPQTPPRSAAYDLAAIFPKRIGGERRDSLCVGSGWRGPMSTMVAWDVDGIAEEVYLATGAGYYDVATASGMSLQAGFRALLTGYQIAGADEVVMRQVLEEILLPRLGGGEARSEPVKVAGRDLVLVRVEDSRLATPPTQQLYVHVSGDTIWSLEAEEPHLTELLEQLP